MLTASASSATSPGVSRSGSAVRGCGCPGDGKASFPRRRLRSPRHPPGWSSGSAHVPARRVVAAPDSLAPSPRKRTRAPEGPADRVERSSPAFKSQADPPTSERMTSQTGVPPPRTGQNEMKPGADFSHAGPPGVSAHICGCQGAGSVSGPPVGHGKTPRPRPAFHRAGECWRGRTPGPPTTARQRRQARYTVGRLSTPVLWSTPSRSLVSDLGLTGRGPRLGTKKAPNDM